MCSRGLTNFQYSQNQLDKLTERPTPYERQRDTVRSYCCQERKKLLFIILFSNQRRLPIELVLTQISAEG
jgi:hypothetical protein